MLSGNRLIYYQQDNSKCLIKTSNIHYFDHVHGLKDSFTEVAPLKFLKVYVAEETTFQGIKWSGKDKLKYKRNTTVIFMIR